MFAASGLPPLPWTAINRFEILPPRTAPHQMAQHSALLDAIRSGDINSINDLNCDDIDRERCADRETQAAIKRAADQVVFHRLNYHKVVKRVIELGVPCDIWTAARAGIRDHVKQLLADEPSLLNAVDTAGRTPLQRATLVYGICLPCEEVADLLLAEGATCDTFSAATMCFSEVVTRELSRHPTVIAQKCQGASALNWAVRPRRNLANAPKICKALLDAGADPHDCDEDESGMTPLHHAAEWGPAVCLQIVDVLLDADADINGVDSQGWTPLDYAQDRGRSEMVNYLTSRGAISKQPS